MSGQWWENDLIVGPFADIPAANAWAAANPSSLFPGLLATAAGIQYRWGGVGVGWAIQYPSNLFWRGGMSKFRSKPRARVAVIADSNGAGFGAGTGPSGLIGARALCWPVVMAKALGWQTDSFFGEQNVTANAAITLPLYDPRVTSMGSWGYQGNPLTFGGRHIVCTGNSSSDMVIIPEGKFDTVILYYPSTPTGDNTITVKVDGTPVLTASSYSAENSCTSVSATVTNGMHTISIQSSGSAGNGVAYISGLEIYDSTNPAPILLMGAWNGARTADLAYVAMPWSATTFLRNVLTPDVQLTHCTINDINNAIAVNTIIDNFGVINYQDPSKKTFDVVNTVSWPYSNVNAELGQLDTVAKALQMNSVLYGGAFADARAVFGASYNAVLARGMAYDALHLKSSGYSLMANFFKQIFL